MSVYLLNEPAILHVVERLGDGLAGVITELNADVTDGLTIDEPAQILDFVPQLELLTEFPTIAVQDVSTRFEDDIGSSATGLHGLAVVTFLADADQRSLAWGLRRYARAVTECLLRGRGMGLPIWGVMLDRINWGPTLEAEENPRTYMSWVAVVLELRNDDD